MARTDGSRSTSRSARRPDRRTRTSPAPRGGRAARAAWELGADPSVWDFGTDPSAWELGADPSAWDFGTDPSGSARLCVGDDRRSALGGRERPRAGLVDVLARGERVR